MKILCIVFCVLCASAGFGQSASVISTQPVPIAVPSHPEHASQKALDSEQSLLGCSTFTSGHGQRPLWEFASKTVPVPLGDIARGLRNEHAVAKKSATVIEN